MGGLIILSAIIIPTLLFAKLHNSYIILMLVSTIWLGAIGFTDDYIKVFQKNKEGIRTHLNIGKIAQANQSNAYTIPLVFTTEEGTKTYRQMMSTSLGETKQQLLAIVKDLFDGLKKADEMSRKYVVTGKPDDGGKAINGMRQANEKLLALSKSKKDDETSLFDDEYQSPDINAEN